MKRFGSLFHFHRRVLTHQIMCTPGNYWLRWDCACGVHWTSMSHPWGQNEAIEWPADPTPSPRKPTR